ncbi:hypothetical protein EVAR_87096_1 [Eumeta japonica]|uniref:Reverse transcriptase domain-containing protein n=1 Tax=Eumeta variegata TaxID=151549 RepID=A0A4C1VQ97_EUMVA|nr:hypothetical protein EVAR_87096_1 [Eumeta japonica]
MKSVIFGAACSPCIALYTKNLNTKMHRAEFPEAVESIVAHHYVDDFLQSFESIDKATGIATEVQNIQRKANFHLKKWTSNIKEVIATIDP